MWKAAFGGRSERGSTVGVDDTASTASRRRRHRRSSNDDKSVVSSTSRRTDGDRDREKKRHSRHESGVSYGSAPIPRLTESAVNAFNANDDDDDIWEDEADLKSERRSEHKRSGSRERRRKSSGRSERSERSRSRERDDKHKKSSGRSERSRSRERDGWTRKSTAGRSEKSRSREREDRDGKKKDEKSSRTERPNGKSRVSKIVDNSDAVSVMPSTFSIDRFPSVNPSAVNPSTVRFDEHTMSGALDSHVTNQFPGQNPSTYAKSDFEPNPHGAAADYYKDRGQSVKHQPGERAFTPKVTGSSSVAAPSGSTKPTKPTNSTKQSSSSSSSVKPSRKSSSRGISPPAASSIVPAAASAVTGAYAQSSSRKSSRAVSPPAADRHMQTRASTQYEPSAVSQNNYRPAPSEFSAMPASEFSAMPPSEFSAMPPSAISGLPHSTVSGQPPRPVRYNSEPPPTVGAASSYYEGSEMAPSRPAQSGMYPSSQSNSNNNAGKYAVAGAAAAGMAAYGISQHNQHNQQSEHHQHTQQTQQTQYTQHTQQTQYNDDASRYGAQSHYGSHAQAPYTPSRPGSQYDSASGALPTGMHHRHEHKGPISRLKDGFLNLISSPEDVAKMEEYTEYIGVCKNCFDPHSSPYGGPRKHHYHPKKKDSFETLRRRSLERMQRRRSDESLRRTNSKVQKENRYFSSTDRKTTSTAGYMAGGLAVAGAATAGAAMFNDRKNFDDTYSVKSGHRASSAIRRRGSNSSAESRRRSSRGRIAADRQGGSQHGHDEFITVRTKDGRVENRKVHRSRSGSTGRKSNWMGSATSGAALGAAGAAIATERHRRRSSPDQVSLRHNSERRYRSRSSSKSHRMSGGQSQYGRSRSSSRSRSPGLGEIFGFTNPKPRRSGRRSPFGSYQDSKKERRHRSRSNSRNNKKGGFFTFSNGSASSSESGMAFGDVNGSSLSRKSSGKRKVSKKSSDEKLNATLLGIGATAAALTAAHKFSKSPKQGRRPELGARRDVRVSQYGPDGRKQGPSAYSDEGEWVDELPSEGSSNESGLAFDNGNVQKKLSSRPSMDSIGSSTSSNDGLSAWGWRWGNKKEKTKKQRPTTPPNQRQHSVSNNPVAGPVAAGIATGAALDARERHVPSDVGLVDYNAAPQAPMQYIEPQPLSDVGSRHPSMPGAFEDPPLQQPQPITPFQPAFTQGSPEDPMRPTAGPSSKPPMRRSASSPVRNSKGSFMGDAAFIGGAAVATAGIIASQNRRASPGSVRFGFNGEQQEKFDREVREEREREETERRRADRTRALKEEAERFAREEEEKRLLDEFKRQQREDEEREHQRQLEANQREEAYRREQARNAEESRRRAEEQRQAEEEERQQFNDRQIRDELERKQREREEKSSRKKKDKYTDERSEASPSSWKGPVAAGMAGALAGAVLDGALHKQGRERAEEKPRSRDTAYSTQTFEPTNDHSGAPITDDDLADPDFFKRRNSPADLRRYEEFADEKLDELTNEREDYYNMPSQSQKDFFMPKELLEKSAAGKERAADPYGDNEVDVYQATGGEARHIHGSDFGRYGKAPVVHQNVPKLNVIAPTPPHSTASSVKGDRSAPHSPLADLPDDEARSERADHQIAGAIATEAEEATRHIPGGFEDSVHRDQQHPDAAGAQEPAWEPPLSKKDKKKRDKTGKRESAIDSEPGTPREEVIQDVSAPRAVSFDAPEDDFAAPVSKKDKKKKGKAAKQTLTFDDEPAAPFALEAMPEPGPMVPVEEPSVEDEFAPLSKKDKKKKSKKGMSFEDSEPTTPAYDSPSGDPYFAPGAVEDRSFEPTVEDTKDVDEFQPLSKKDKKKKSKKSATFEDSEPTTPAEESTRADAYFAPEPVQDRSFEPVDEDIKEVDDFQPLSKKDKKKKGKKSATFEDSEPSTPVNERSMPEYESEPVSQAVEAEAESAWGPPLSKKDKKKREKEAKSGAFADEQEFATPLEESVESWSETREPEAESAWEPPVSKKDKKKREKEAKNGFSFDSSEPGTPVNEPTQHDVDPLVQEAEAEFEAPLAKKDKKKREKEAQRQSLSLGGSPSGTPANELNDPLLEQTRELDPDPLASRQEVSAEPEWEPPISKKDKKKREKEAQKGMSFDDAEPKTSVDDFGGVELERAPEPEADAAWEPPLSKKDKKKKESKRQSVSFEDLETSTPVDEFAESEQVREPDTEGAWEPPLSKKEQKKRDKEAKSFGFGDVAAAVMTTAGVAAIADAVMGTEDEDYSSGKKSKKNKKKSESFDESPQDTTASDMPGTWDESSSDAAKDASAADRDFSREDDPTTLQDALTDEPYGSGDTKKSKKKKKRESGRFNEPATGSPLRSEVAFDDYLGSAVSANGDAQSTGYGRGGSGPSYFDDNYPISGSPRAMSPDDAHSTVSAPSLERRKSNKSKSKRRSGVYDEPADFDDNRSIHSAATEPASSSSSSKKEKKGGLFGLFSRKSSDGDKRDQSFLGERVEDLPPLPLSRQNSAISASAQEEQDHGTPASAEAGDQAVIVDAPSQSAPSTGSIYTEAVPGSMNVDIWGDPMGDVPEQPDVSEDVWGDEEFADRPSLPREATTDQSLDPMAAPAEGATPTRTGGPMTNVQEDFDDWFGSTDPTPKAPLLLKGKKGKKSKKGKAVQTKSSAPSSPVSEAPKEETEVPSTPSKETSVASDVQEAEKTRDISLEDVASKDVAPVSSTEPVEGTTKDTQPAESTGQDEKFAEPISTAPTSESSAIDQVEDLSPEFLATRRPSLTPRPLSSTAVPLRFRPIPSSPSNPRERSMSFGSPGESAPLSPASVTGSNKKPRPRSSEFREVRPLYLVSRNSKLEDVEEQLPDLPDSKPSSRASSVQGSEDWHSAAEDMSPQPDLFKSPGSRGNLTIDLDQANRYRTEEEIMDTADQTTPKASDFPQTALLAPRSHSKQVPQFYTWEDLAKDEEMHEAAARQAEGTVESVTVSSAEPQAAEGLGIEQTTDEPQSAPARTGKKDKRKSKGLAAAALLAGGAAAAMATDKSDDPQMPTSEQEPDSSTSQPEQPFAEGDNPDEVESEQIITDGPQSTTTTALDATDTEILSKESTSDVSAAVPEEAADDFFSQLATKKQSKKAKKNKKSLSTPDDLGETPPVKQAPASKIPTEGAAAEYFAATEDALAKEKGLPAAEPELPNLAHLAEAETAPAEDEWASMSISKKGKKAKKGKKLKADAWAEAETEQSPIDPEATAPSDVSPEAIADNDNVAATPTPNDNEIANSTVATDSSDAADDNIAASTEERGNANADQPSASVEPVVEQTPKKEAAAAISRGWFSWPFGAKKAAEEGLEVDPVTMQAREVPDAANEIAVESIGNKNVLESLKSEKPVEPAVPDDRAIGYEAIVPEYLPELANTTTDLPAGDKALQETTDERSTIVTDLPELETTSEDKKQESVPKDGTPSMDISSKAEALGEEQHLTSTADDQSSQPSAEATEVADDLWGAPSAKKKKGKKGKKSGQSTPLVIETPTPVEAEKIEVQEQDGTAPQASETVEGQVLDGVQVQEAQPKEEDSLWAPQPSNMKGKKGRKSDLAVAQTPDEPVVEGASTAPESSLDQLSTQEAAPESSLPEAVEVTNINEPEEIDSLSAPQSTKKKSKKNKKGSAAASALWDEPVAEDTPVEATRDQSGEATPPEPKAESQELAVNDFTSVSEAVAQETAGPAEPAPEPEADDMWDALPSKKKGKKGKKAAKGISESMNDDPPRATEAPLPEDVASSLDANPNELSPAEPNNARQETSFATQETPGQSLPSEQLEASAENSTEIPAGEQETVSELKSSEETEASTAQQAATPSREQEPTAEPEDFWAPEPKGKKAKKGKKARQDANDETIVPSTPNDLLTAEDGDSKVPVIDNAETGATPVDTADDLAPEASKEAVDEDLWGPPTKGKKAKKSKKGKGNLDISETHEPEMITAASELQPSASDDVPAGAPQEPAAPTDAENVPEVPAEQDAVPEDDWSSLTTSKKGKKAKKSKKATFSEDPVAQIPTPEDAHSGEANVESTTAVPESIGDDPIPKQDAIVADSLPLPVESGGDALPELLAEQSNDKNRAVDGPNPVSEIGGPENISEHPTQSEAAAPQESDLVVSSEELPKDAVLGNHGAEPLLGADSVASAADTQEPAAAEVPTDFEPLLTKKSKKDKKKSKKSQAFDFDELVDSTQALVEDPATTENSAAADDSKLNPESPNHDPSKQDGDELPAQEEPPAPSDEAAPAEETEDFGSFSTKKSKKDKKKSKKGKANDVADLPTPASIGEGAAADYFAGESATPVPDLDATAPPNCETEDAAADRFTSHPDDIATRAPATDNVIDRELTAEQPVEPTEEFSTTSAKSKKDKKKAKKTADSSWETEGPSTPLAGEEQPSTAAVEDTKPTTAERTETDPVEDFGALNSKSKKDKKKAKKASTTPWDEPADVDDMSSPAPVEDSPVEAEPVDEFATSSSKKSKKDKKKGKKTAADSWDVVDPDTAVPADVTTSEANDKVLDDPATNVPRETLNDIVAPAADVPVFSGSEPAQDPNTQTAGPGDYEAKDDDDSAFPTKKSEKDKKNATTEPEVATPVEEPSREINEEDASADKTPSSSEYATPLETVLAPGPQEEITPALETPATQDDADFFGSSTTKKSKKDKKKSKKGQAASWDEPEVATPPVDTQSNTTEPSDVGGEVFETPSIVPAFEETPAPNDALEFLETKSDPMAVSQPDPPQEETDYFGSASTKKSKKDKKKGKKASEGAPWDDGPVVAEPATEQLPEENDVLENNGRSLDVEQDPVPVEDSETIKRLEPSPTSAGTPAEETSEAFGSASTKKSKKDKKKGKKAQEDDWQTEEPAPALPTDPDAPTADLDLHENIAVLDKPSMVAEDVTTAETPLQEQNADASDVWAAAAKKSKKDKKKGKKAQLDEDIVPTPENETPTDATAPADTQELPSALGAEAGIATESTALDTAEAPVEEDDAWGSISTKKSKKDKKKSKKSKAGGEDPVDEQSTVPVVEDSTTDLPSVSDTARGETAVVDPQNPSQDHLAETSIDNTEGVQPALESLDRTIDTEPVSSDQHIVEDVGAEHRHGSHMPTASGETPMPNIPDSNTRKIKEAGSGVPNADTATSEHFNHDIDFAATLAAGLADTGFDPNLVVDDPVFHRRASPPSGVAEADPEEISTASSKKKKGKGKKARDATLNEPIQEVSPAPTDAVPDDFDAALSRGLQDSGFDPALLANAGSPSQGTAPAELKDEDDEFSFTKSNKKKKKGKKSLPESVDATSPTVAAVLETDQQPVQEIPSDKVKTGDETLVPELDRSQAPGPAEEANPASEEPSLEQPSVEAAVEPVETGKDEWAAPSKSKKKGKKDKKSQDRSLDLEVPAATITEPVPESRLSDMQDVQKEAGPAPHAVPEEAPLTEATGEDEWGVPSRKKKGKQGKKQQDSDWQDSESIATPLETPAEQTVSDNQLDPFTLSEQPSGTPTEAEPTLSEEPTSRDAEQTSQVVDDEWAAPSKKKKDRKGKKQQDADWQDADTTNDSTAPSRSITVAAGPTLDNNAVSLDPAPAAELPIDEAPSVPVETQAEPGEDEWASLSSKKKKGKKSKKNQASEPLDESTPASEIAEPVAPADEPAVAGKVTAAPDNVVQGNIEPAEAQLSTNVTSEEPPAVSEAIDEEWGAPSSKKDKKKKKKMGVDWFEPETPTSETPRDLLEDSFTAPVDSLNESDTLVRDSDGIDRSEPVQGAEAAETAPIVPGAVKAAEDEWAANAKKKKKGKKGKKSEDVWAESETPTADAAPEMPVVTAADDQAAKQPEDATVLSRDVDQQDAVAAGQLDGPVTGPAEEWGLPSKKKGKKDKKKLEMTAPEVETATLDPSASPVTLDYTPMVDNGTSRDRSVPEDESASKADPSYDGQAAGSPAPADPATDNWALPVKKKGKKGKMTQLWAEDEPQASVSDAFATTQPEHIEGAVNEKPAMTGEPELPAERSLDEKPRQVITAMPDEGTEQPSAIANEDGWGAPSKKKGKKNKKKGGVSDADLDPFIDTPTESSAPISTTDTADASAAEGGEPATEDTLQPSGEMDVDEMDKAYKAYKKNKRKQKKLQSVTGGDDEVPSATTLEESSEQQHNTSRDLDIPQETALIRQPSPLASEEPSWSFAKLDGDNVPGDTGRGLTKMTSRGSLTSRRSLEPLHLDTASPPVLDQNDSQRQEEQQAEAPRSAHGRTASRDTPLEPTSRQRASYLFQSPAPFQDLTPNNASSFRTPEQRGDASDYFHSRGVETPADDTVEGPSLPSAGLMSPRSALHAIPEESTAHKRSLGEATNITPMEPAGKHLRRTETPKAIREQSLISSANKDGSASVARSVSNPMSALGATNEGKTLKRVVSDTRSPSAMSSRSNLSLNQHVSPDDRRTLSRASNRSVTPTLRRTHLSGDLRAASRTSNRRGDSGSGSAVGARSSPKTIPFEPPPTPPLNDEDEVDPGATRAAGMAETFQGFGGGQVSQVSPTRPPSMRKRQSMHVMDLETKLEQLSSENRALQEAQQSRGLDDGSMDADNHGLQQALDARELELREKNNEIQHIQAMLEPMQQEINRLVQINGGLTDANRNLVDDNNDRYATLQNDHANVTQQWQNTTRDLENMRQEHSRLSSGMRDAVAAQLSTALAEKDHEIRKLKDELAEASDRIRALQVQIQSSKSSDFLNVRDEDYFDGACQKLCQHVQQWVLRFSKMSDNRICRLSSDLRDEKIEARLDNALLDGMDVDKLLGDRVRRRDVFMSVVMTMVWEYVFTRYLFGMDREQRQKLKALEKTLSEVGPPRAVAQWRATTLTLLAKRPAFSKQCALDTEAVAHEIFGVLSALLTPPTGSEPQLLTSLTKVITVAVNLSVEMRTQRSEYIMLPPLQPEYDTNGDLVRKVHFNASLMNERSGLFTSNQALEAERAIVKIVLFPLVVKKGDEFGEGEEEIVVCPAQVLVHNDSGKSRKVVRVMSGAMEIDDPRRSKQSLISKQGSMQF